MISSRNDWSPSVERRPSLASTLSGSSPSSLSTTTTQESIILSTQRIKKGKSLVSPHKFPAKGISPNKGVAQKRNANIRSFSARPLKLSLKSPRAVQGVRKDALFEGLKKKKKGLRLIVISCAARAELPSKQDCPPENLGAVDDIQADAKALDLGARSTSTDRSRDVEERPLNESSGISYQNVSTTHPSRFNSPPLTLRGWSPGHLLHQSSMCGRVNQDSEVPRRILTKSVLVQHSQTISPRERPSPRHPTECPFVKRLPEASITPRYSQPTGLQTSNQLPASVPNYSHFSEGHSQLSGGERIVADHHSPPPSDSWNFPKLDDSKTRTIDPSEGQESFEIRNAEQRIRATWYPPSDSRAMVVNGIKDSSTKRQRHDSGHGMSRTSSDLGSHDFQSRSNSSASLHMGPSDKCQNHSSTAILEEVPLKATADEQFSINRRDVNRRRPSIHLPIDHTSQLCSSLSDQMDDSTSCQMLASLDDVRAQGPPTSFSISLPITHVQPPRQSRSSFDFVPRPGSPRRSSGCGSRSCTSSPENEDSSADQMTTADMAEETLLEGLFSSDFGRVSDAVMTVMLRDNVAELISQLPSLPSSDSGIESAHNDTSVFRMPDSSSTSPRPNVRPRSSSATQLPEHLQESGIPDRNSLVIRAPRAATHRPPQPAAERNSVHRGSGDETEARSPEVSHHLVELLDSFFGIALDSGVTPLASASVTESSHRVSGQVTRHRRRREHRRDSFQTVENHERETPERRSEGVTRSSKRTTLPTVLFDARKMGMTTPENVKCSICLEDFQHLDKRSFLPCFHSFHKHCISRWLQRSSLCPICLLDIRKLLKLARLRRCPTASKTDSLCDITAGLACNGDEGALRNSTHIPQDQIGSSWESSNTNEPLGSTPFASGLSNCLHPSPPRVLSLSLPTIPSDVSTTQIPESSSNGATRRREGTHQTLRPFGLRHSAYPHASERNTRRLRRDTPPDHGRSGASRSNVLQSSWTSEPTAAWSSPVEDASPSATHSTTCPSPSSLVQYGSPSRSRQSSPHSRRLREAGATTGHPSPGLRRSSICPRGNDARQTVTASGGRHSPHPPRSSASSFIRPLSASHQYHQRRQQHFDTQSPNTTSERIAPSNRLQNSPKLVPSPNRNSSPVVAPRERQLPKPLTPSVYPDPPSGSISVSFNTPTIPHNRHPPTYQQPRCPRATAILQRLSLPPMPSSSLPSINAASPQPHRQQHVRNVAQTNTQRLHQIAPNMLLQTPDSSCNPSNSVISSSRRPATPSSLAQPSTAHFPIHGNSTTLPTVRPPSSAHLSNRQLKS